MHNNIFVPLSTTLQSNCQRGLGFEINFLLSNAKGVTEKWWYFVYAIPKRGQKLLADFMVVVAAVPDRVVVKKLSVFSQNNLFWVEVI